jgi:hypothetical protein
VHELRGAPGLRGRWYISAIETAGQIGSAIEACMAVSLGLADHVLVFRSVWESTAQGEHGKAGRVADVQITHHLVGGAHAHVLTHQPFPPDRHHVLRFFLCRPRWVPAAGDRSHAHSRAGTDRGGGQSAR